MKAPPGVTPPPAAFDETQREAAVTLVVKEAADKINEIIRATEDVQTVTDPALAEAAQNVAAAMTAADEARHTAAAAMIGARRSGSKE